MARLNRDNVTLAEEIISRYPKPRSALIPLLHLAQEQDGHLTEEAMRHVGELVGCTPAEVVGTASFYEMLKPHPVGRYVVNVCTDIACLLVGGQELLEHAEATLGVTAGSTTEDGSITLEDVDCIAACTEAPCLQANYRYFTNLSLDDLDRLLADLRAGELTGEVPDHGTLARVRQRIPVDRAAGPAGLEGAGEPVWMVAPADRTSIGRYNGIDTVSSMSVDIIVGSLSDSGIHLLQLQSTVSLKPRSSPGEWKSPGDSYTSTHQRILPPLQG